MQALWTKYKDAGLVVIGFPSNEFGGQEPASNKEIAAFAETQGATFPLLSKGTTNLACREKDGCLPVSMLCCRKNNGVYEYLKGSLPITPSTGYKKNLSWNFEKFLVGKDGKTIGRWPTSKKAAELEPEILAALEAAEDPATSEAELEL